MKDWALALVFIAGTVSEAKRAEAAMAGAGLDFRIEAEEYVRGIGFPLVGRYTGLGFYVLETQAELARQIMRKANLDSGVINAEDSVRGVAHDPQFRPEWPSSRRKSMNAVPIIASITSGDIPMGARSARHLDRCWRYMMRGRDSVEADRFLRVLTREKHPLGNVAIISDASSVEVTRAAVEPLIDLNLPATALYTEGITEGVAQSLVGHGFEPAGEMPAMAVDIERVPAKALPPGFDWLRVDADGNGPAWSGVLAKCFEMPPTLARRFSPECLGADMAVDATVQYFGISHDGQMVATVMLFLADGLAGIYSVATLPPMRGQGLGAYATAEALRTAHRLGYRVGVLQSSASGHSVYRGLGFQDLGSIPMFIRMPT